MTVKNLSRSILRLTPNERLQIVQTVLESLHTPDPDVEKAWIKESERRFKEYKQGKIKTVPLDAVKKQLGLK